MIFIGAVSRERNCLFLEFTLHIENILNAKWDGSVRIKMKEPTSILHAWLHCVELTLYTYKGPIIFFAVKYCDKTGYWNVKRISN